MNNFSQELRKVLEIIKKYGPIRSTEIVRITGVSTKTVYKHLTKLLEERLVKKTGATPRVFYSFNESSAADQVVSSRDDAVFEQNYLYSSPNGEIIRGVNGFLAWCRKNNFDFNKEKKAYLHQLKAIRRLRRNGLYSAKKIILSGKHVLRLDNVFFSDFYTFGHFGKTKLGQLVYLGKTSQDKELIAEIASLVRPAIIELIKKFNIKAVCFIPPTIDRKVQFMDVFKKWLKLSLPEISVVKIPGAKVAQKTLRKLEDRMENARKTIAVNPDQKINHNILIIDDATGSGATLNETAKKIRNIAAKKIKIFGYSAVGSYKGFDVISEV